MSEIEKRVAALSSQVKDMAERQEQYDNSLTKIEKIREKAEGEIDILLEPLDRLLKQYQVMSVTLAMERVKQLENKLIGLEAKVTELQSDNEDLKTAIRTLSQSRKTQNQKIAELKAQIEKRPELTPDQVKALSGEREDFKESQNGAPA